MIDFKQPVTTRHGSEIKLYECFEGYCIGAWFDDERWVPCSWTMPNGFFLSEQYPRGLDLINAEPYKEEDKDSYA